MEVNKFVLEDLYKLFTRQLSYFARQLQLKHGGKYLRRGKFRLQPLDDSIHCMASDFRSPEFFFHAAPSLSSSNRDAVWFAFDSSAAFGSSVSRSSIGSSSQVTTSFAPCLISVFGQGFLLVTFPGTAKTSRFCSRARREVKPVLLYLAGSITKTPIEISLGKPRGRRFRR